MLSRRALLAGMGAAPFALIEPGFAQLAGNAFIVSGFPAGGMGDLVSRPLAEKLRGTYADNMLVESKVGAGGRIAAEFVKRANPDGLTILQIPSSVMVLYPHIYKNLAYDPFADFAPVTMTTTYVFPSPRVRRCRLGAHGHRFRDLGARPTRANRPLESLRRALRCTSPA